MGVCVAGVGVEESVVDAVVAGLLLSFNDRLYFSTASLSFLLGRSLSGDILGC